VAETPILRLLELQCGSAAFARGERYARDGAVVRYSSSGDGRRIVGEVRGSAPRPYVVTVTLVDDVAGLEIDAGCTCPVGYDCKHIVALVLVARGLVTAPTPAARERLTAGPVGSRAALAAAPAARGLESWERALRPLTTRPSTTPVGEARLGLQFETGHASAGRFVRLRPVLMGVSGRWTKSQISWRNLDYAAYSVRSTPDGVAQLALLKEIQALSHSGRSQHFYSYQTDTVSLAGIDSRRIWDLLAEARDRGVALVRSGRLGEPVALEAGGLEASLDVVRAGDALVVGPAVRGEGFDVPRGSWLTIGDPVHGLAWWSESPAAGGADASLHLGALRPGQRGTDELLALSSVTIPAADVPRFLESVLPGLRRRVPVISSDGSVDLPETTAPRLRLDLTAGPGAHLQLDWSLSLDDGALVAELWDREFADVARELEATTSAVASTLESCPSVLESIGGRRRLAAHSSLDAMATVGFMELLEALEALEQLEVVWHGEPPSFRESLVAPAVTISESPSAEHDWFDLAVSVSVEGETVPFAALFIALARGDSHLILPSGTYFALDRPELRELAAMIAESRELFHAPPATLRVSRYSAGAYEDLVRLGIDVSQAGRWERTVRSLVETAEPADPVVPAALTARLRAYQRDGFRWLAALYHAGLGGILADDMGLGKTVQALALIAHVREEEPATGPFLVLAPTSVVGNWVSEARRFAPDLRTESVTRSSRRREETLAEVVERCDVVVTSYALFRLDADEYARVEWAGAFLDEAQFAKNRQSQTYLRLRQLRTPVKFAMTGTPIENNLMELWSLISIVAPGLFPSPERFEEYFRGPIERHHDAERLAQLRRRIGPLLLRRTKELVARELPAKQEQVLTIDLAPAHHKLYQSYLARERKKVLGLLEDAASNRFEILKSLTLLRMLSLDASLVDPRHAKIPSSKLDVLMDLLGDALAEGHRVLVFSQFTTYLDLVRRRLEAAGVDYCHLTGRTRNREAVISRFREGHAPVFLISLKAGGFGLNLVEADYCFILDPWWNPATEAQAVDRIHRIGQTRRVMVYRLVARETIEEKVMALKGKKALLFASVLDGGQFAAARLSAADIRGLMQ
jgi:superfamily II DNA or RNA helicase